MKRFLKNSLLIGSMMLLMLASCKKNDAIITSNGGKAGTLTASSTSVVLLKANDTVADVALSISFTAANYGFKSAVSNTIEIDNAGDNWAKPISITLAAGVNSYSYTTAALNKLALGFKIGPDTAGQILVRLVNAVSVSVTPVYSNVLTLTVTPYSTFIPKNYWYVPGSYQGWAPASADSLQETTPGSKIFTGVIALTGDLQFKVVPTKASNYAGNLGDAGAIGTVAGVYTANVSTSGGNITGLSFQTIDPAVKITTNMVTLNLNTSKIAVTADSWGVVGSATAGSWPASSGFQDDVDMKFNNGTQTWSVILPLTAGGNQIKFRRNHDWNVNYGGDNGVIAAGGDNINVPAAGNYKVTLDLVHNTYELDPQ